MIDQLAVIRNGVQSGRFPNEASVSTGVVLRLLNALGWPVYDPEIVYPEYPLVGRRVDFALCSTHKEPLIFIEVKQVGLIGKGDRQLFEYAFMKGIPMAILTDGREWHFYLPGERGDIHERRVYLLDILERDLSECQNRLQRYLDYQAVCTGAALEAARGDYRDAAKERVVKVTLPTAWQKLLEERDELLIELISDKVESLCGFKPTIAAVVDFLEARTNTPTYQSQVSSNAAPVMRPEMPPKPVEARSKVRSIAETTTPLDQDRDARRAACVAKIQRHLTNTLVKRSSNLYSTPDGATVVCCFVSREYPKSTSAEYWYGFRSYLHNELSSASKPYVAFGCGSDATLLLIPYGEFQTWLDGLNITQQKDHFYWHVKIASVGNQLFLMQKKGLPRVELSRFRIE